MPGGAGYSHAFYARVILSLTAYARAFLGRFWRARWLQAALILALASTVSDPALARDATVRDIQRLLWSLEYGAERLDGVTSAEMSGRIRKFLSDRGKSSLSGEPLLAELRAAFEEKTAKALSASNEIVDRVPLIQSRYGESALEISPDDNVVMAGTCPINRARLSDGSPLKAFRNCGFSFRFSRSLNLIVSNSRWSGNIYGLLLIDAKSGLQFDFIEVTDADAFSKIALSPNGKEVLILTTKTELWRVNLESKAVSRVTRLQNSVTKSVRFSPDGRFYAVAWSAVPGFKKHLSLWNRSNDQQLFEVQSENFAFSNDGRFFAFDAGNSMVEIRDTASGRSVFKKKFDNKAPYFNQDGSVAFNRDGSGLLYFDYDGNVHEWTFQSGAITEKVKPRSEPERALIRSDEGKIYTTEGARIGIYSLDGQSNAVAAAAPSALKVRGGAISADRKLLAAYNEDTITLVDVEAGRLKASSPAGIKNIGDLAFAPGSTDLIVGTGDGEILRIENGTNRRIAKLSEGIKAISPAEQSPMIAVKSGNKVFVIDLRNGRTVAQTNCECFDLTASGLAFVDNDRRLLFTDKSNKEYRAVALDIASGSRIFQYDMKSNVKRSGSRTTWMRAWIGFVAQSKADRGTYWVGGKSFGANILYQYSNGRLTPRRGSQEGTLNFYPASSDVADTFEDGGLLVVLGNQPKVSSIDGDKYLSEHLELRESPVLVAALSSDRFVTLDQAGEVRIYGRKESKPLVRVILYEEGDWLSRTEPGFFAGTRPAAANLFLAQGASAAVSLDSVFDALYRPDLVSEAALGDPSGKVKAAAGQLDLEKVLASGPAPKVAILSPESGGASAVDEVEVQASVTDKGGGVGKVEWRVNGVTLGVEERGFQRIAAGASGDGSAALTVKRKLVLEQGDNRIEILAYNDKNLIASEVSQISVKWSGERTATPPKLYVLAVGVNDYFDSRLRLAYAVPDANALADGFQKASVGLYGSVEVSKILDTSVTAENLDKVFNELGAKVQPRDVFVFFLAGHGKTKNGRYYFLPRDFRYEDENSIEKSGIGQDKFQTWFSRIAARKSILLYDTCESGSLTGANARGTNLDERLGALTRMARATGRTFLTATTDDAPALEGFRGHGVFTYALLDAIDRADVNKNGLIEVSELADYIDQMVPDYSYEAFKLRQVPQRSIIGNNFPIVSKVSLLVERNNLAAPAVAIPAKPSHVVIAPADVYEELAGKGGKLEQLSPGTLVSLVKVEQGWVLVARDGKAVGYVAENQIARMQ